MSVSLDSPSMLNMSNTQTDGSKTTLGDSSSGGGSLQGHKVVPIAFSGQEQQVDPINTSREPCCSSIRACMTAFCACIVFCNFKER